MLCLCVLFAPGCSEPLERERLRIEIEADAPVQALVDAVDAVIEYSTPNGGWRSLDARRFEPRFRNPWPIEYVVGAVDGKVDYQLIATARDEHGSILATARALRDWDSNQSLTLRVFFETPCIRRPDACASGLTCHAGACVDAHLDTSKLRPNDEPASDASPAKDAGPDPGGPVIATEGEPCDSDGTRACTGEMSRAPLFCEAGVWKPSPVCSDAELCDTTMGSHRGTCRAIAPECLGKVLNREFCDRDVMRVCMSMFQSEVRPCGTNERCASLRSEPSCACRTGFVNYEDGLGCREPMSCEQNNGGCDRLTQCSMKATARTCGACPAGYVGDGYTGCEPLLADLAVSVGRLEPAFDPNVHAYRVKVPLLAQRVAITPTASAEARIELNGTSTAAGQPWTTPTLQLGEYPLQLTLTAASDTTSTYEIVIEREGSQRAYLKASNASAGDGFGAMVSVSGDTLVVGAMYEDSGGDQGDNGLESAGAAYVFVRRGERWEQQAYLKPTTPLSQDRFGCSVAISGDTIVVGAIHAEFIDTGSVAPRPGVAYVFARSQAEWSQVARLSPPTGSSGDLFGYNVAIDGDTLVVGAPKDAGSGAAYVYTRTGGEWREQQKLKPTQPVSDGSFGSSVAISGDALIVGSDRDSTELPSAGSAYVFARNAGHWSQTQRIIAAPPAADAGFGYALAMHGDRALIGAPRVASISSFAMTDPGEVFAFKRNGATWKQTERLRAMLPRASDSFGSGVAVLGETALVGACGDASGAAGLRGDASRRDVAYAGAGYLFALEGDSWQLSSYLKAEHPDRLDAFGFGAALGTDIAVLSAIWESSSARTINGEQRNNDARNAGAVYLFQ